VEYRGAGGVGGAYVAGINQLYEYSCGALSGWLFRVNGGTPGHGSGKYELQDGDVIEWLYSCDLGRDITGYPEEQA